MSGVSGRHRRRSDPRLHCSTKWSSGMWIGPKVTLRNVGDFRSLVADKGYDSTSFREALRAVGRRPLVKHRVFTLYDYAHNADRRRALSPVLDDSECELLTQMLTRLRRASAWLVPTVPRDCAHRWRTQCRTSYRTINITDVFGFN